MSISATGFVMTRQKILRCARALAFLFMVTQLCGALPVAADPARVLVLATHKASSDITLNKDSVRKLYLGMPDAAKAGVTPICNHSDKVLYEVFLQKVVFLSAPDYERLLVGDSAKGSPQRPPHVETMAGVLKALAAQPSSVTYMWLDTVEQHAELKVVKELWRGPIN